MIPVDKLQAKSATGFQIKRFDPEDICHPAVESLGAHRDDHYIFFVMLKGSGSLIADFEEITVSAGQLYYLLPEQIHYRIKPMRASGWFVAVYPSLIGAECRSILESWSSLQKPFSLKQPDSGDFDHLLRILYNKTADAPGNELNLNMLHALLSAFLEMTAGMVRAGADASGKRTRPFELFRKFKQLLNDHIRNYKSPSDYAAMLHISEHYLNESIRKVTGSSVSFWIRYRLITEAKRLLHHSDLNVKQIAGELGFENPSYFSRFFTKETGMSALAFRKAMQTTNAASF